MSKRAEITSQLDGFRKKRDWQKFHTPQNLAKSIVLEASELLEIFQWKLNDELTSKDLENIKEELADIYNWTLLMAHDLNIDLEQASLEKISSNEEKYPTDKVKGKAIKYTEIEK